MKNSRKIRTRRIRSKSRIRKFGRNQYIVKNILIKMSDEIAVLMEKTKQEQKILDLQN